MDTRTARKIERFARVNGVSWSRACSEFAKRGAVARRAKARRKTDAEVNDERFRAMRAAQPMLYE